MRTSIADGTSLIVHNFNASCTTDNILQVRAKRNTTNNTFYAMSYYNEDGAAYRFRVADSGAISTAGSIQIGDAGAPPTSGVGIKFPATQSASSDVNTLDDYEEGTFTPTISGTGSNPVINYATRVGVYTKVGRVVTVHISIQPNGVSTAGTGNLQFTGLPFTSANIADCIATGVSSSNGVFGWGNNKTMVVFNVTPNSSIVGVLAMENGVTEASIPVTNFELNTRYLGFSITYITAT